MSAESIKVAVRVRPFNGREIEANSRCIIRMKVRTPNPYPLHPYPTTYSFLH